MKKNNMKTYIQICPITGNTIELRQKNEIPFESIKAVVCGKSFD